jgi:hypothetical protein
VIVVGGHGKLAGRQGVLVLNPQHHDDVRRL